MSKVIGLILSGGAGTRLGGVNKGLVEVEGKPLIQWVYDALSPQVDEIYISANENINKYQEIAGNVLSDDEQFYRDGPLAGIHSLAKIVDPEDIIQVVTCDLPLLPKDLVLQHLNALEERVIDAIYPKEHEREHYGLLMFRAKHIDKIEQLLLQKQRRIRDFLSEMNSEALYFDDASMFINGNDWLSIEKIAEKLKEKEC